MSSFADPSEATPTAALPSEFRSTLSALAARHTLHSTPSTAATSGFALLELGPADTLLDVGCGDGRVLIAAAQTVGCRAVGWEIHEARAAEARANVAAAGLAAERASVFTGNIMEVVDSVLADGVTAVYLYLNQVGLGRILPYLRNNPTTLRVACYCYEFRVRDLTAEERKSKRKAWVGTKPNMPEVKFPVCAYLLGGRAGSGGGGGDGGGGVAVLSPQWPSEAGGELRYASFPKVELHRHLEGAVRASTVLEEAQRHGVSLPHGPEAALTEPGLLTLEGLRPHIQSLTPFPNLASLLSIFDWTQVCLLHISVYIQSIFSVKVSLN